VIRPTSLLLFSRSCRVGTSGHIRHLSAGSLAVFASWPAARAPLTFLQFLLGSANAPFSGRLLFGVLDPADEFVPGQRRDVLPGNQCSGIADQRIAQVSWEPVHHPTGHSRATHEATVASSEELNRGKFRRDIGDRGYVRMVTGSIASPARTFEVLHQVTAIRRHVWWRRRRVP